MELCLQLCRIRYTPHRRRRHVVEDRGREVYRTDANRRVNAHDPRGQLKDGHPV